MADEQIIIKIEYDTIKAQENVDKLTKEIVQLENANKELKNEQKQGKKSQEEVNKQIALNSQEIQKNKAARKDNIEIIKNEIRSLNQLKAQTSAMIKERNNVNIATKEGAKRFQELTLKIQQNNAELKKADAQLGNYQRNVGNYGSAFDKFNGIIGKANSIIGGFGITLGATALISGITSFVKGLSDVEKNVRLIERTFSDLGNTSRNLATEIEVVTAKFGVEFKDVMKSASIISHEFGISAQEAVNIINQGFEKGADVNGEFLELLKEYPAQFNAAGLNAKQMVAIIAETENLGIFSDKGIDAIKEGGLRLRENTKAVEEALKPLDEQLRLQIKSNVEQGKTFEAIKLVSKALNDTNLTAEETQKIITDVFGGAGEDAGLRFLQTIKNINTDLDSLESNMGEIEQTQNQVAESWVRVKNSFQESESVFGQATKGILQYINNILQSLLSFSEGDWLTKLKLVANQVISAIELPFKPFILLIEKITGKDLTFRFDIPKINSSTKATEQLNKATEKTIENNVKLEKTYSNVSKKEKELSKSRENYQKQINESENERNKIQEKIKKDQNEQIEQIKKLSEEREKASKKQADNIKKEQDLEEERQKKLEERREEALRRLEELEAENRIRNSKSLEEEHKRTLELETIRFDNEKERKILENEELQLIEYEHQMRIDEINEEFAQLQLERNRMLLEDTLNSFDIILESAGTMKDKRLEFSNELLETAVKYNNLEAKDVGAKADLISGFSRNTTNYILSNNKEQFDNLKANEEAKIVEIQKRLAEGVISEGQAELDILTLRRNTFIQEQKLKKAQFEEEKMLAITNTAINTAAGAVKALASIPPPLGFVVAGTVTAFGLAQGLLIGSKTFKPSPLPPEPTFKTKYKEGGEIKSTLLQGKSHAHGGINLYDDYGRPVANLEGGERLFAMKKDASAHISALSNINEQFGGKAWVRKGKYLQEGGEVDLNVNESQLNESILNVLKNVNFVVKVEDIETGISDRQNVINIGVI